jgi:hypothetical protein
MSKLTARGSAFQYRTPQNASFDLKPLQNPLHQPSGLQFGPETALLTLSRFADAHDTNFVTSVGSFGVGADAGEGRGAGGGDRFTAETTGGVVAGVAVGGGSLVDAGSDLHPKRNIAHAMYEALFAFATDAITFPMSPNLFWQEKLLPRHQIVKRKTC